MFYALYYPGMESPLTWISADNMTPIQEMKQLCEMAMESSSGSVDNQKELTVSYINFYKAMSKIGEGISSSDIVSIIWLAPSFNLNSNSCLSVEPISQNASFLFQGLEGVQSISKSSSLTIITHEDCPSLALWTKLLKCEAYCLHPSQIPLFLSTSQQVLISGGSYISTSTDSTISSQDMLNPPSITLAEYASLLDQSCDPSFRDLIYSITLPALEGILHNLLRSDLSTKYKIEWRELNGELISQFDTPSLSQSSFHMTCLHLLSPAKLDVTHSPENMSELLLDSDQPIQLLVRFNSAELFQSLHVFLEHTRSFRFAAVHPQFHSLHSLLPDDGSTYYYGCSVAAQRLEKPVQSTSSLLSHQPTGQVYGKVRYWIGLLAVSEQSIELFVACDCWEQPEGVLRSLLEQSLLSTSYVMIMDSDLPAGVKGIQLTDQFQQASDLVVVPTAMPPISRDVVSRPGVKSREVQTGRWREEQVLKRMSERVGSE